MQGYWITFEDGSKGYCQGQNSYDAVRIAEHISGKKVKLDPKDNKYKPNLPTLPYPAQPVIWQFDHPVTGITPTFCYYPGECSGHTCCPRNISCTS